MKTPTDTERLDFLIKKKYQVINSFTDGKCRTFDRWGNMFGDRDGFKDPRQAIDSAMRMEEE